MREDQPVTAIPASPACPPIASLSITFQTSFNPSRINKYTVLLRAGKPVSNNLKGYGEDWCLRWDCKWSCSKVILEELTVPFT